MKNIKPGRNNISPWLFEYRFDCTQYSKKKVACNIAKKKKSKLGQTKILLPTIILNHRCLQESNMLDKEPRTELLF